MWTQFWDMHSGGSQKEQWAQIFIEAPEDEATVIFYNRFGHNPHRVTCTCCGSDYSISSEAFLAQLTGFHRHCKALATPRNSKTKLYEPPDDPWFQQHYYLEPEDEEEAERRGYKIEDHTYGQPYQTIEEYAENDDVLIIFASDIKPEERQGTVPVQGYVWQD